MNIAAGWIELNLLLLVSALLVEAAAGYPKFLFAVIRHPVVWIGALIGFLDRRWNRATMPDPRRRLNGVLCVIAVLFVTVALTGAVFGVLKAFLDWWISVVILAVLASTMFAQRSLYAHVANVRDGLKTGGLEEGRAQVRLIVGRDPESLDGAGVARAAVESLAENFSDGVVAPAFWCAVGGLPGLAAYKAINTADSMIGHKDDRYRAFGWCAARLDDLVNLPASRLSALWLILASLILPGASARSSVRAVFRDARRHRSPNAGWPEAAMAGALDIRLGGPRHYPGQFVDDAWMGDGRPDVAADDIDRALKLYLGACAMQIFSAVAVLLIIALA